MKLIFLLEELSMKTLLDKLLPRIIPETPFITIAHEGKSDLEKSIPAKLRGWTEPNVKFVIVQDQDTNDCIALKNRLRGLCGDIDRAVLIRIACHELESWYFGDLSAVSMAYQKDLRHLSNKAKYRVPDNIVNPKQELKKLLPMHQQISGARKIAPYMDIENNTSASFRVFVEGVKKMVK